MEFEFDLNKNEIIKNEINKNKHGIDFNSAREFWDDPDLIEIPLLTEDEPRFLIIGMIAGKHWSGIITYRGDVIRIISVRRSRKEEVQIYEST